MTMRLLANSATVAVYDYTAGNDDPFTNPLGDLSRLRFHSGLQYPAVIYTWQGSVTIPAVDAQNNHVVSTHVLFAHGRSGVPFVEGKVTSGLSTTCGLCGSLVVQQIGGTLAMQSFFRVVHLGADGTNVVLNSYCTTENVTGFPALTLGITVYLTDLLVA